MKRLGKPDGRDWNPAAKAESTFFVNFSIFGSFAFTIGANLDGRGKANTLSGVLDSIMSRLQD
ncbi:hypothetical protein [Rhizobium sp. CNPSo 3490]|uniref:hypothetical protein n=1 Tax=Rhizobium sp. CNPSo 3490 TaxID=3021407 RepID=UPI00254AD24D|nr:hypothetical protein [Rhizobium sp. CNPSo 3490]MDK4733809.1 hypothetical protein [Rhizobium sp. CNPSo 3490]